MIKIRCGQCGLITETTKRIACVGDEIKCGHCNTMLEITNSNIGSEGLYMTKHKYNKISNSSNISFTPIIQIDNTDIKKYEKSSGVGLFTNIIFYILLVAVPLSWFLFPDAVALAKPKGFNQQPNIGLLLLLIVFNLLGYGCLLWCYAIKSSAKRIYKNK